MSEQLLEAQNEILRKLEWQNKMFQKLERGRESGIPRFQKNSGLCAFCGEKCKRGHICDEMKSQFPRYLIDLDI